MKKYITVNEAASLWGITPRRVRILCSTGKIADIKKEKGKYLIPLDAAKPIDGRILKRRTVLSEFTPLFQEIDNFKSQLSKYRPLTPGELRRLREEFLVEFTYNSNAIEGNTLTLQETAMVLEGITIDQKPLREHLEVIGHRDAFVYVEELAKKKKAFSKKEILDIHSLVLMDRPEDKGVYRKIPVRIMGATHIPPDPIQIPELMEKLLKETKESKLHPIEEAALFHLKFEGIHPFIDGNGRTGRLLMNLMLMRHGYSPIDVKFKDRKKYYKSFDIYYSKHSPENMIELISGYVKERLQQYLKILSS